ncbi:MAG: hypothetical protein RL446_115 [Pseudomonadota bacterium]
MAQCQLGQGTLDPYDEAHWLLVRAMGWSFDAGPEQLDRPLSPSEQQHLKKVMHQRLVDRQPTAYILGEAWLMGESFACDRRAIIPRSFIAEFLVAPSLTGLRHPVARILELCTGGGSLSVLAAKAWPAAKLTATDLDPDALALAQENIQRHGLTDRITTRQGDLFDALQPGDGPYDLILCNPPYVPTHKTNALPAEFRAEPHQAFEGGRDGMDLVRRILKEYPEHLIPGGLLVVEIGHEAAACQQLFEREFPNLKPRWLPTATGLQQVFALGDHL